MEELAQDVVKDLFDYKDGSLVWKVSPSRSVKIGAIAGTTGYDGRQRIGINGSLYLAHRIIFLWHHGYLPKVIDHIDNDSSNNRIENLRECSKSQNQWNSKARRNNKSGFKNVYFDKEKNKWRVLVECKRKKYYGGYFSNIDDAVKAASELRNSLHKEFTRDC
jgi:hypothetical protein